MKHLVPGAAGFIRYPLAGHLGERGNIVVGVDNLKAHHDPARTSLRTKRSPDSRGFTLPGEHQRSGLDGNPVCGRPF